MCIFISKTIETAQGYPVNSSKQLKLLQWAPRLYLNWTLMIATENHCSNKQWKILTVSLNQDCYNIAPFCYLLLLSASPNVLIKSVFTNLYL